MIFSLPSAELTKKTSLPVATPFVHQRVVSHLHLDMKKGKKYYPF